MLKNAYSQVDGLHSVTQSPIHQADDVFGSYVVVPKDSMDVAGNEEALKAIKEWLKEPNAYRAMTDPYGTTEILGWSVVQITETGKKALEKNPFISKVYKERKKKKMSIPYSKPQRFTKRAPLAWKRQKDAGSGLSILSTYP